MAPKRTRPAGRGRDRPPASSRSSLRRAVGLGGGDAGVFQRLLDLGLTERAQVPFVVLDLLKDERLELETHAFEIEVGLLPDAVLEPPLVAVQLLQRERADDAPQVARDGLLDGALDLRRRHPEETLGRLADVVRVALDLDLGDRLDVDRDALDRVDVPQPKPGLAQSRFGCAGIAIGIGGRCHASYRSRARCASDASRRSGGIPVVLGSETV